MILSAVGFTLLFTGIHFNFWGQMALTAGGLAALALIVSPELRIRVFGNGNLIHLKSDTKLLIRDLGLGIGSAILLYGVFWMGNILARNLFDFAGSGIDSVYAFKSSTTVWVIALLIALIIGPAEEIFWRGYIQDRISKRFRNWGWLGAALIYAAVHIASLNIMLIVAALVCGLFWGWVYKHFVSMRINIISHVTWDLTVFLILPLH